jgi:hypothetical protein
MPKIQCEYGIQMLQKFSVGITYHLCMFSLLVETVLRNCFHSLDGLDETVHPECRRSKFCQHSFNSSYCLIKMVSVQSHKETFRE